MTRIPIYLITNRHLVSSEKYFSTIKEAAEYDNLKIILREKDLNDHEYKELYLKIKEMIPEKEIIINSKVNVLKDVKEKSIQLSFYDFIILGKVTEKVGVSVHSVEEAIIADQKGADYLLVSHIFETSCKKGLPPKGIKLIQEVKAKVKCKVIALGGINAENFHETIAAGADGIAIMSLLFYSDSIKAQIEKFN